jgi:hypothetical protein
MCGNDKMAGQSNGVGRCEWKLAEPGPSSHHMCPRSRGLRCAVSLGDWMTTFYPRFTSPSLLATDTSNCRCPWAACPNSLSARTFSTQSLMLSLSQILPAAIRQRPVLRIVLFFLIFGIFLVLFLPPTGHPSFFVDVPNFFTPNSPLHIPTPSPDPTPPQSTSHRNRIKAQRPSNRPGRKGDVWSRRADAVRDAFLHAYKSYLTHAAPHDELRPLSKAPINTCVPSASSRVRH